MLSFLTATTGDFDLAQSVIDLLTKLGEFINLQYILIGAIVLMVIVMVTTVLVARRSYEYKLLSTVTRLNKYFMKNPFITEENLIEVNNMMKSTKVPRVFRYCWQEYMLNRDTFPSDYMSSTACIDQPIKTSSYSTVSFVSRLFLSAIAVFSLLLNVSVVAQQSTITEVGSIATVLLSAFFTPCLILLFGYIFSAVLKMYYPKAVSDLYTEYHEFERFVNKACSTMPTFVDYEVLFTQKEISKGIPVLQEYLEKRAIEEQKQLEEQQVNTLKFEDFDFNALGVENALLLDRAMLESEKYFNVKRNLTERVTAKEQELYNFQKKFDEVTKDFERKAQAVRENLAQINEQMNNTTIKIELNYQKKRYNEEQQKLQQLEKDYEQATQRFNKQQDEIKEEVEKYTKEIADRKAQVEANMSAEGRTYANKIFGQINKAVFAQNEPVMKELNDQKTQLENDISVMQGTITNQDAEISQKAEDIKRLQKELDAKYAEIEAINNVREYFGSPEFRQRVSNKRKGRDEFADIPERESKTFVDNKVILQDGSEEDENIIDAVEKVNKQNVVINQKPIELTKEEIEDEKPREEKKEKKGLFGGLFAKNKKDEDDGEQKTSKFDDVKDNLEEFNPNEVKFEGAEFKEQPKQDVVDENFNNTLEPQKKQNIEEVEKSNNDIKNAEKVEDELDKQGDELLKKLKQLDDKKSTIDDLKQEKIKDDEDELKKIENQLDEENKKYENTKNDLKNTINKSLGDDKDNENANNANKVKTNDGDGEIEKPKRPKKDISSLLSATAKLQKKK